MLRLFLMAAVVILVCGPEGSVEARCRVRKCRPVQLLCQMPVPAPVVVFQPPASTAKSHTKQITETVCDGVTCRQVTKTTTVDTAQARAVRLAQLDPSSMNVWTHDMIGRLNAWEGLGCGISPDDATRRSCMWGQRVAREIGTAQGRSGRWYAVVLYH